MKILLVNKAYFPHLGGVETIVRQLAEGMVKRGHEATVLCFGDRDAGDRRGGAAIRKVRPMGYVGSAPVGFRFVTEFFRLSKQADVINFHSPNPMGELALLLSPALHGKKIICTYHGDAQRPKLLLPAYDFMLRKFFRRCGAIAVSNPPLSGNSRVLKAGDNSLKEKIRIIPWGVRTENYSNHRETDIGEARRLLASLPSHSFKVMYAGRMVYYKGLEVLLEALRTMKAQGHPVSAFLVGSGPEERNIRDFVADNALESDILIIPHQLKGVFHALFSLADCFVLPSTHQTEAFGIVLAEAMASGLPVVSTELGTGTSWVNKNGETGIVVPPGDHDALAEALVYLADNEKERNAMAASAMARARNFFEEDAMLDAYEKMFNIL